MHTRPYVKQVEFLLLVFSSIQNTVLSMRIIPKITTHLYTCGRSNENEAHLPVFSFI